MKRKVLLVLAMLVVLVIAGCGGKTSTKEGNKTVSKSKIAEVEIEKGTFVKPFEKDGEGGDDQYIALEVKVKNTGKEQTYVSSESFALFEKGEDDKISPNNDYGNGIDSFDSGKLSAGKSLTRTILFNVDDSKEYTLAYSPTSISDDGNEVEIVLDLSKYEDTKKILDEPKDALAAFIDVVFLNKENADYDKLVSTDSEAAIETVKKAYSKNLKNYLAYNYKPTDDEINTYFSAFREVEAKRATYENTVIGNVGDKALIKVEMKGLSNEEISDVFGDYRSEYLDEADDYDSEKADQYAFTKYTEILEQTDLGEPRNDLTVFLTKKDGKWDINLKSTTQATNEYLQKAFIGGVN